VYREDSHGANGNTMDAQGRLYSCEYKARRVTRTDRQGKIEVLVDKFEGKRFNAPNDIVVRRDGHVYFTDPLFTPLDQRDLDFYGVYHVTPSGGIEAIARLQTRPNGIALSPDGRILYVANTDEMNVRAYDIDASGRAFILKRKLGLLEDILDKRQLQAHFQPMEITVDAKTKIAASSIVNGSFLALISNQNLRTTVITGRPDLGAPDWRMNVPGRPMSAQEITDVVSWLASQRPQFPGRPYPNPSVGSATRAIP
jgi:sugar lactone lactonase YvrE